MFHDVPFGSMLAQTATLAFRASASAALSRPLRSKGMCRAQVVKTDYQLQLRLSFVKHKWGFPQQMHEIDLI